MGGKSPKLDFDLNSSFALANIPDFLASLSMISDASKKLTKLDDYIHELEAELIKIDGLIGELPLCMLLMIEGIDKLKEERMRTEAEARPLTGEFSPLKGGDNSNEATMAKKSSNHTQHKNWMSWTTQYENFDMKKQDFASNLKSDVKQENGSASKNSYDQICRKLKKSEGFSGPIQRQSGLLIKERNNLSPVIGLPAAVSRVRLGPTDTDLKRNMIKTSTGLPASISRVEWSPIDMNIWKRNMNKISTGLPTSVPGVELGSNNMNLKRNISETSPGSSLTTNSGKKPRRLCWPSALHNAVQQLGDPNVSTSKETRENMQVAGGLSNNEVVERNLPTCCCCSSSSKLKSSEGHFGAFERQSGVIINEKKNLLAVNGGPSSSVPREEKGNITKPRSDPSLSVDPDRKPRRCWSNELHSIFVNVLQHLGGPDVATPKQIREMMQVDGLTNDEVKSHLQKYRLHLRKSPERSTASSSYTWPGRGCRHLNMSKGSTSQSVSRPLNINGSAKEVSTTGGASNAPKNTTGGDENAPKNKHDKKSGDHN